MVRWCVMVAVCFAACDAGEKKPEPPAPTPQPPPAMDAAVHDVSGEAKVTCSPNRTADIASAADVPSLAAAVLGHYASHPDQMQEWNERFNGRDVIFVRDEIPVDTTQLRLTTAALHSFSLTKFVVKTRAELQSEATRTGRAVPYLAFGGISFDGQCANVQLSLTLMPPKRGVSAECCTGVVDTFAKRGTTWSLIERGPTIMY
jgi:hypothetical protein